MSTGSDQGRSFQAFYDFPLSQARQQELSDLLERVHQLSGNAESDPRLRHVHYDWLQAAEAAQATVRQLSEQLRRFLDDQVWFENRRVIDLLRDIEGRALSLRDEPGIDLTMEVDALAPDIKLPMERPLYAPIRKPRFDSDPIRPAGSGDEIDPTALFEQVHVDPGPLRGNVRAALRRQPQVALEDLVRAIPLTHGVAELVTYLSLRDDAFTVVYDDTRSEQVSWAGPDGRDRTSTATLTSASGLPRFQQQFKTYLNQNTIREIAQFQAQLNRQSDLIRQRVGTINASLVGVDYNPGRYIRLEPQQTPNIEIREFRTDVRACTDNAVSPGTADDQYSEQKSLQVKRIIERFKSRPGQTEADQKWTRLVTDVRNWYVFTASERYREDDSEYETYADSGGKSGGQKEKLAYTILAASLAYQFKLEWGAAKSRTFRFAVIDEAFGRGSDESTRFALELFGRLGLQLLIVTPLQKIHVIEPYVSAVGFVDNPTSRYSRLRTLTIEEYRAERLAHVLAAPIAAAVA